jgi:hypothetical protein
LRDNERTYNVSEVQPPTTPFCEWLCRKESFLKKWWVESDFKAPNLPLSLRLKDSGCHYNSIYNNTGTDSIVMDLSNAFDKVDHNKRICNLSALGVYPMATR